MKTARLLACLLSLLLLPSCWDIKDLQSVNYVTSLGLDFSDGQYVVYAQMLDFSSVAKQEKDKTNTTPNMYVGKGVGDSLNLAVNDLFRTAQQQTSFSHVSTIIFTKNFLDRGMTNAADTLFRFKEIRHTPWVFGTDSSLPDIFTTGGFFNLTTLATILNEPNELYRQRSTIAPIQLVNFVSQVREPGLTVLLPSIYVNKSQWRENEKPDKKLALSGIYAVDNLEFVGEMKRGDIKGLRWLEERMVRAPLQLEKDGRTIAVISTSKIKRNIRPVEHAETELPKFSFDLEYKGSVGELLTNASMAELTELAQQTIEQEIRDTFLTALEKGIDIYSLEHVLYRKDYAKWKQLHDEGRFLLSKDSIANITLKIKIMDSGMNRIQKLNLPREE
ncbi:Ger(x)C family spore germination protein [Paenibacillus senegalensis]|uniref:Ger(x)C family spore germination protein n=1 Tax=Paenibacillus senegalensis TaxID=1465766 RepID=UPI0002883971|nr:Ger(x)C family spore germination protein [Paenibacillus senegalensis]